MKKIIYNAFVLFGAFCLGYLLAQIYVDLNINKFFEPKQKTEVVKKEEVNKSVGKKTEEEYEKKDIEKVKEDKSIDENGCKIINLEQGILYFLNPNENESKFIDLLRVEYSLNIKNFNYNCYSLKYESESKKIDSEHNQLKVFIVEQGEDSYYYNIFEKRVSDIVNKYNISFKKFMSFLYDNCDYNLEYNCEKYLYSNHDDLSYFIEKNNYYTDFDYDYYYNNGEEIKFEKTSLKNILKGTDLVVLNKDGCLEFLGIKNKEERVKQQECEISDSDVFGVWGKYLIFNKNTDKYYKVIDLSSESINKLNFVKKVFPITYDFNIKQHKYLLMNVGASHNPELSIILVYDILKNKEYQIAILNNYSLENIKKKYDGSIVLFFKYNKVSEIKVGDYSFKASSLVTADKYIKVNLNKYDFDLHIEKPFGKVDMFKNGNISINRGTDNFDYIIPAYKKADKKSEKMLLLTNKEKLLENNPLKFKYGSFKYPKEVLDINLVFEGYENNFVKMKLYIGDVFKDNVYFEKKFFNFLNY